MIDLRERYWPLLVVVAVIAFWLGRNGLFLFSENTGEETVLRQQQSAEDRGDDQDGEELITVHIAGEVENPGVYRLPAGSRTVDAILAAGGESSSSNLNEVNLARIIIDGERIFIPGVSAFSAVPPLSDQPQVGGGSSREAISPAEGVSRIDINSADIEQLTALPGIGEVRAADIISYREEIGSFSSVEEIIDVPGIGEVTLDNLRELITVN